MKPADRKFNSYFYFFVTQLSLSSLFIDTTSSPPKKKSFTDGNRSKQTKQNPDKEIRAERIKAASVLNVPEPPFALLHFCRWAPYICWNKLIGGALVHGRVALITESTLAAE